MTGKVTLWAATLESLELAIETDSDPTSNPPQFGVVAAGSTVAPTSFVSGSWADAYSAAERTTARTPTLGAGGAITLTSGTTYDLWIAVTLGGEVAKWPVGQIHCP